MFLFLTNSMGFGTSSPPRSSGAGSRPSTVRTDKTPRRSASAPFSATKPRPRLRSNRRRRPSLVARAPARSRGGTPAGRAPARHQRHRPSRRPTSLHQRPRITRGRGTWALARSRGSAAPREGVGIFGGGEVLAGDAVAVPVQALRVAGVGPQVVLSLGLRREVLAVEVALARGRRR